MKKERRLEIQEKLRDLNILEELSAEYGIEPVILEVLFNQMQVSRTRANFHVLREMELVEIWQKSSILEIASELCFPPVIVARVLLSQLGFTRGEIRRIINNPSEARDQRLVREISQAVERDAVYSPWAEKIQRIRAGEGERLLARWLEQRDVLFLTQEEYYRVNGMLTPDFLVDGLRMMGLKINWMESKAMYGSEEEHRRFLRGQYSRYIESFGAGAVVYWYGYDDEILGRTPNLLVLDNQILEERVWKSSLLAMPGSKLRSL